MRAAGRLCLLILMSLSMPLAAPGPLSAEVPASTEEITLSFAPVVKSAAPAVVSIFASRTVAERISPFANDPFFSQFFDFGPAFGSSAPRVENALGSGVILRGDGIVVTNNHVVDGAEDIRAVLADGKEFAGKVILADAGTDLAVIRLDGATDLPALALSDSDLAEVGDLVLAIGNPFGVGQTVTSGIVSALARAGGDPARGQGYFIQTDAPINPGNSGGALVDTGGRLLGINTMILTRSGGSNGIGFAIPANLVAQYVAQAEAGAPRFTRPWSGVEVQRVDADMAEALGLETPEGVVISHLHPESPFARAGLRPGDVLTRIAGHPVNGPAELDYRLAVLGPGGAASVAYRRGTQDETADVALIAAPDRSESLTVAPGSRLSGLTVAALDPGLIDQLRLPLSATGVVVTGVAGPAQATGLRPGDIVIAVNGNAIRDLADFDAVISAGGTRWTVEFLRGSRRAMLRLSGG